MSFANRFTESFELERVLVWSNQVDRQQYTPNKEDLFQKTGWPKWIIPQFLIRRSSRLVAPQFRLCRIVFVGWWYLVRNEWASHQVKNSKPPLELVIVFRYAF